MRFILIALFLLGCTSDTHPEEPKEFVDAGVSSGWRRTLTFRVINPEAVSVEIRYQPLGGQFTRLGDWSVEQGQQSIDLMLPKYSTVVWMRGLNSAGYQVGSWAKIRSLWNELEDVQ